MLPAGFGGIKTGCSRVNARAKEHHGARKEGATQGYKPGRRKFEVSRPKCEQAEERELERVREAEARRATKELMMAQRAEEELKLKRNIEERAREKAEEAAAREKIRIKLGARPLLENQCGKRVQRLWL